jgi:hypothetical protein
MKTLPRAGSSLVLATAAAFVTLGALCSCSNDDSSPAPAADGGAGDDGGGTFTINESFAATGGHCSGVAAPLEDSDATLQIVVTCLDAPGPVFTVQFARPYPPVVDSYATVMDADNIVFSGDDRVASVPAGTQSLLLYLTAVDPTTIPSTVHGTVMATFSVTLDDAGTGPLGLVASF